MATVVRNYLDWMIELPWHKKSEVAIDLEKALNEGLIFGAALDVFSKEPVEINNPLLKNKKVILSPHSATFTDECTSRMGIETTKNIIDFFIIFFLIISLLQKHQSLMFFLQNLIFQLLILYFHQKYYLV